MNAFKSGVKALKQAKDVSGMALAVAGGEKGESQGGGDLASVASIVKVVGAVGQAKTKIMGSEGGGGVGGAGEKVAAAQSAISALSNLSSVAGPGNPLDANLEKVKGAVKKKMGGGSGDGEGGSTSTPSDAAAGGGGGVMGKLKVPMLNLQAGRDKLAGVAPVLDLQAGREKLAGVAPVLDLQAGKEKLAALADDLDLQGGRERLGQLAEDAYDKGMDTARGMRDRAVHQAELVQQLEEFEAAKARALEVKKDVKEKLEHSEAAAGALAAGRGTVAAVQDKVLTLHSQMTGPREGEGEEEEDAGAQRRRTGSPVQPGTLPISPVDPSTLRAFPAAPELHAPQSLLTGSFDTSDSKTVGSGGGSGGDKAENSVSSEDTKGLKIESLACSLMMTTGTASSDDLLDCIDEPCWDHLAAEQAAGRRNRPVPVTKADSPEEEAVVAREGERHAAPRRSPSPSFVNRDRPRLRMFTEEEIQQKFLGVTSPTGGSPAGDSPTRDSPTRPQAKPGVAFASAFEEGSGGGGGGGDSARSPPSIPQHSSSEDGFVKVPAGVRGASTDGFEKLGTPPGHASAGFEKLGSPGSAGAPASEKPLQQKPSFSSDPETDPVVTPMPQIPPPATKPSPLLDSRSPRQQQQQQQQQQGPLYELLVDSSAEDTSVSCAEDESHVSLMSLAPVMPPRDEPAPSPPNVRVVVVSDATEEIAAASGASEASTAPVNARTDAVHLPLVKTHSSELVGIDSDQSRLGIDDFQNNRANTMIHKTVVSPLSSDPHQDGFEVSMDSNFGAPTSSNATYASRVTAVPVSTVYSDGEYGSEEDSPHARGAAVVGAGGSGGAGGTGAAGGAGGVGGGGGGGRPQSESSTTSTSGVGTTTATHSSQASAPSQATQQRLRPRAGVSPPPPPLPLPLLKKRTASGGGGGGGGGGSRHTSPRASRQQHRRRHRNEKGSPSSSPRRVRVRRKQSGGVDFGSTSSEDEVHRSHSHSRSYSTTSDGRLRSPRERLRQGVKLARMESSALTETSTSPSTSSEDMMHEVPCTSRRTTVSSRHHLSDQYPHLDATFVRTPRSDDFERRAEGTTRQGSVVRDPLLSRDQMDELADAFCAWHDSHEEEIRGATAAIRGMRRAVQDRNAVAASYLRARGVHLPV